jgi:colanic acid/amylovoran biosynthesis glycosyltransferase
MSEGSAIPGGGTERLRVAYVVNRYPFVSHTFIRREILALERRGVEVERITVRHGDVAGDEDRLERDRTRAVLSHGWILPVGTALATALRRPRRFAAAARLALALWRGTGRLPAVHASYLVQACVVARWVRRLRVQHLHAHFGTNSADVAALAATLAEVPWSFTVHGPDEFDRPGQLNLAEKVRQASFVVVISSFGRSQVYRWVDHDQWSKVHVVRCGIDGAFRDATPTAPPAGHRLACIGRLSEQKGQELLVWRSPPSGTAVSTWRSCSSVTARCAATSSASSRPSTSPIASSSPDGSRQTRSGRRSSGAAPWRSRASPRGCPWC